MSERPILRWPDRRLRMPAEPVAAITDDICVIWTDMIDTMEAMPGVGLAAPQLGVSLRLAVVANGSRHCVLARAEGDTGCARHWGGGGIGRTHGA